MISLLKEQQCSSVLSTDLQPASAEIQYQGMINHSKKDVAALKWTYTDYKFLLLHTINYSHSLQGCAIVTLPYLQKCIKALTNLPHKMLLST